MAHKINEECISCGTCADTCPVSAIAPGDSTYVVDPDTCVSAKKIIYIEENINRPILRLRCDDASVIEVYFDNEFIGRVYGENNTLPVPSMAADERHVVEIRCFPSGFNLYGDRAYIFGDTGRAVRADEPGYRADDNVKLVNWKIPREIELIREF